MEKKITEGIFLFVLLFTVSVILGYLDDNLWYGIKNGIITGMIVSIVRYLELFKLF